MTAINKNKKSVLIPLTYFRESCEGESPVMTVGQIRRYVWGGARLSDAEIRMALRDERIAMSESGYWWSGAKPRLQDLERIKNLRKRLPFAAKLISWIPFIVSAGVMNSLATGFTHPESDIDLFVITKPSRMWTARGFLLLAFKLVRRLSRVSDEKKTARLSPDFFMTEDRMDLSKASIPHDYLLAYWACDFYPIYGMEKFDEFWVANSWLGRILPEAYEHPRRPHIPNLPAGKVAVVAFCEKLLSGSFGDRVEKWWRKYELARIETKLALRRQPNALVIISDSMIKVHFDDNKRERINEAIESLNRELVSEEDRVAVLI